MLYSDDDCHDSGLGFLGSQLDGVSHDLRLLREVFCRCANNRFTLTVLLENRVVGLVHLPSYSAELGHHLKHHSLPTKLCNLVHLTDVMIELILSVLPRHICENTLQSRSTNLQVSILPPRPRPLFFSSSTSPISANVTANRSFLRLSSSASSRA